MTLADNLQKIGKNEILLFIITISLVGCSIKANFKNPQEAAMIAETFCHLVFVDKDWTTASKLLVSGSSETVTQSRLKELINATHPDGKYPLSVFAEEYEIVPNSPLIRVFLKGKGKDDNVFYYCLIMRLEPDNTYRVSEIYRNKNDIPYREEGLRRVKL